MHSAAAIRVQIETALAHRIPSALTPGQTAIRPVVPTGVATVDALLEGGLPVGAITEMVGPESSGRTSLALSFLAGITRGGKVVAWIDVCDVLHPESAAAAGIDLARMLWVRCGVSAVRMQRSAGYDFVLPEKYFVAPEAMRGLHGGGFGPHPRTEVKRLPEAVSDLLRPQAVGQRRAEPQQSSSAERETIAAQSRPSPATAIARSGSAKPWTRIEQALRATDLVLQAGGFSAVVLDMGSIAPEHAARVPLATWFRYRAAAERTQASVLLLTQHCCAKSSGEVLLRFQPGEVCSNESTVFTGIAHGLEVARRRFTQARTNVIPLRKPPQSAHTAGWRSQSSWAGPR